MLPPRRLALGLAIATNRRMELVVRSLPPVDSRDDVEIAEHKGIGHPDTICDALAESFASGLAKHYRERFGTACHFNVDKALLVGGESRSKFGGGVVIAPMRIILAGRATRVVGGEHVPVESIAAESARAWMREHLHAVDAEHDVRFECAVRGGSSELVGLFGSLDRLANDSSFGTGYAPLSRLERAVLAVGDHLRCAVGAHPEIGEDVKILGVRHGTRARFTVACAFVDRYLPDLDAYLAARRAVERDVSNIARGAMGCPVEVEVNCADDPSAGRVYLTVTGTSAEAGDDGEVGRGNRVNGLITPYRPMSLEAAAGKNPTTHVGKLYNLAAHRIAAALVDEIPEITEAHCTLASRIGRPIVDPALADVRVRVQSSSALEKVQPRVREVVARGIAAVPDLAGALARGALRVF